MCVPLCLWVFPFHSLCDAVMQWNTRVTLGPSERHTRGRGNIFNLTTEPVSLLLLPLRQFTRSLTIVPWCDSCNREVLCAAATEVPQPWNQALATLIHDPWMRTFVCLTCLWKVHYPRQCTARYGAAGLDTEGLPGPAGETGGCGRAGAEQHCWGVFGESTFMFLLSETMS